VPLDLGPCAWPKKTVLDRLRNRLVVEVSRYRRVVKGVDECFATICWYYVLEDCAHRCWSLEVVDRVDFSRDGHNVTLADLVPLVQLELELVCIYVAANEENIFLVARSSARFDSDVI
jgi:hypothetical protein